MNDSSMYQRLHRWIVVVGGSGPVPKTSRCVRRSQRHIAKHSCQINPLTMPLTNHSSLPNQTPTFPQPFPPQALPTSIQSTSIIAAHLPTSAQHRPSTPSHYPLISPFLPKTGTTVSRLLCPSHAVCSGNSRTSATLTTCFCAAAADSDTLAGRATVEGTEE